MQPYTDLLRRTLAEGNVRTDRTGVGTLSVFGGHMSFDLSDGFPLLTTKYTDFRVIKAELLWMLSGSTNINDLDAHIWDAWADDDGELGPIYGLQWRHWHRPGQIDQIRSLQSGLSRDPNSRRHIVSAWNVEDLTDMHLAPCHVLFQCYSQPNGPGQKPSLDLQVYQRSADLFLGVPFNIASYALLLSMLAQTTNHAPGTLHWVGGDCHVYRNHVNKALHLLGHPDHMERPLPTLRLNPGVSDIDRFTASDIQIEGYRYGPSIPAPVAV